MSPSEITNLIIAIVSIIPTLVSVVCLIVNIIKNKNWTLMMNIADAAMAKVEDYYRQHPDMSSEQKLEMAIEAVEEGLKVAGITLDKKSLQRLIDYIKQSIGWLNEMNDR